MCAPSGWQSLLTAEDLPPRLVRKAIYFGYRRSPYQCTWRDTLGSLLYIHNETVNIYSHALGAALFVCLQQAHFARSGPPMTPAEWGLCMWFFVGTVAMLAFSAVFHAAHPHSEAVHSAVLACDLSGVLLAVSASANITLWLMFACHAELRTAYVAAFNAVLCTAMALAINPRTRAEQRIIVPAFTGAVLSFALPVAHILALEGVPQDGDPNRGLLAGVAGSTATLGLGLALYVTSMPERLAPGLLDFWLHSHQLWHACIVAAPAVQYAGVRYAMVHARRCRS